MVKENKWYSVIIITFLLKDRGSLISEILSVSDPRKFIVYMLVPNFKKMILSGNLMYLKNWGTIVFQAENYLFFFLSIL